MIRVFAVSSLLAGLAACTVPTAEPPGPPGMCSAQRISPIPGRHMTAELEQQARQLSGASVVRVIRPGQAITRDYNAGRINLQLDSYDVVVRAYCG
ncbi:hypothetical protein GSY71_03840 [Pusillimonas sp. TS35]|uniref:I78 family peptidase inhibitor n=1 Tax=Paracandidimonas lactea TaxID=2895524 RepID=UPI0013720A8B|nr:I78 family peptidase inhibitor [Paracandidimonas lactea]MYN12284.1 hypothetical protein [Pusillimonas sp. TS35]